MGIPVPILRGRPTDWDQMTRSERASNAAQRGWERRRCAAWIALSPTEQHKAAAKRGWESRRAKLSDFERRSIAAKKGWKTRLRNMEPAKRKALRHKRRALKKRQKTKRYIVQSAASRKSWEKRRAEQQRIDEIVSGPETPVERVFREMREEMIESEKQAKLLSPLNPTQAAIEQTAHRIAKVVNGIVTPMPESARVGIRLKMYSSTLQHILSDLIPFSELAFIPRILVGAHIIRADGGVQWCMLSHAFKGSVAMEHAIQAIGEWAKKYGDYDFNYLSIRIFTGPEALYP